jgi:phasin family protein
MAMTQAERHHDRQHIRMSDMATKRNGDFPMAVAEEVEQTAQATTVKGFDKTLAALKGGMSGAAAGFEKTQAEVKANMDKAVKTAEEMVAFSQGNIEAVVKSSQIWAAGVQEFGKTFAATTQAQLDQAMTTWKALAGVKSLKEAIDLQSDLARSSVETAVAQTGKLTDASLKLAEKALAPITARVTLAVEKFARTA